MPSGVYNRKKRKAKRKAPTRAAAKKKRGVGRPPKARRGRPPGSKNKTVKAAPVRRGRSPAAGGGAKKILERLEGIEKAISVLPKLIKALLVQAQTPPTAPGIPLEDTPPDPPQVNAEPADTPEGATVN